MYDNLSILYTHVKTDNYRTQSVNPNTVIHQIMMCKVVAHKIILSSSDLVWVIIYILIFNTHVLTEETIEEVLY